MRGIKITVIDGIVTPAPRIDPLLIPAEVAALFRVDTKTVARWADPGHLTSVRTLGGRRRYREAEVRALLGGRRPATGAAG